MVLTGLALLMAGCKPSTKIGEVGTFSLGERAQVGPLIYNVIDSQWSASLGQDPAPRIPQSRFLVLTVSIVNGGGSDQSVPSFALIDDQGESIPELVSGEGVPDWIGFGRKVRPAESLSGNIAFDVPPKHYKLKVTEENQQLYALVDLPLNNLVAPPITPPDGNQALAPSATPGSGR
jgi:hypothetical protein